MNMLWGAVDTMSIREKRKKKPSAKRMEQQRNAKKVLAPDGLRDRGLVQKSQQRPTRRHSMRSSFFPFRFVNEDIRNFDLHQTDAPFLCCDSDVVIAQGLHSVRRRQQMISFGLLNRFDFWCFFFLRFSFGFRESGWFSTTFCFCK